MEECCKMFELLKNNHYFRRLFAGQIASLSGDWFNYIAILTLIGDTRGGGIMAIAWLTVLKQLPVFLFAAPAGVCADKYDRRKIMFVCDLIRALLVLLVIPASYFGTTPILVLMGVSAVVSAFFDPARAAAIPQIVSSDQLRNANTLGAIAWSLCMLVGAALGGIATEIFGVSIALIIDCATFFISAYFIYSLPPLLPTEKAEDRKSVSFKDFLLQRLSGREKPLSVLMKGVFGIGAAVNFIQAVVGISLGFGESGAGGLSATFMSRALGAITGMVVMKRYFEKKSEIGIITYGFLICGVSYFAVGISEGATLFLIAMFTAHFGSSMVWVYSTVWIQRLFPNEERGRAAGLDVGLFMLTSCVITLIGGELVSRDYVSAREVAEMCGLFWVAVGLILLPVRRAIVKYA
jgi:MFS family permease